jgi:hypothetical protein
MKFERDRRLQRGDLSRTNYAILLSMALEIVKIKRPLNAGQHIRRTAAKALGRGGDAQEDRLSLDKPAETMLLFSRNPDRPLLFSERPAAEPWRSGWKTIAAKRKGELSHLKQTTRENGETKRQLRH